MSKCKVTGLYYLCFSTIGLNTTANMLTPRLLRFFQLGLAMRFAIKYINANHLLAPRQRRTIGMRPKYCPG